jgi:hypothetical protein
MLFLRQVGPLAGRRPPGQGRRRQGRRGNPRVTPRMFPASRGLITWRRQAVERDGGLAFSHRAAYVRPATIPSPPAIGHDCSRTCQSPSLASPFWPARPVVAATWAAVAGFCHKAGKRAGAPAGCRQIANHLEERLGRMDYSELCARVAAQSARQSTSDFPKGAVPRRLLVAGACAGPNAPVIPFHVAISHVAA